MSNIFVLSDIHGRSEYVKNFILRQNNTISFTKETTLILLGDTGVNYYLNQKDDKLKQELENLPLTFFLIRGNHEERAEVCMAKNPNDWHIETYFGNDVLVENKYPSIKYAMDEPAIYKIPTTTNEKGYLSTLVLPGAYSVDKKHRLANGWKWFSTEQPTADERALGLILAHHLNMIGESDLVLSHTCPCAWEPTDLFLSFIDQSKVDKTTERWLGQIEFALNYKAWLWGHYHAFRDYPREDGKRRTMLFNNQAIDLNNYMLEEYPRGL